MMDTTIFNSALVIADVIASHCRATSVRQQFMMACVAADWNEVLSMIEGMLAEPWHLKGHQETRLRDFHAQVTEWANSPEQ